MTVESITLSVPQPLYQRLQERAHQSCRTVEEETVDVLAAAVPTTDTVAADLHEAVAHLALLDDTALWRAARGGFAEEARASLEELHFKQQREGLTEAETQTAATLVRHYERSLLIRARAAVLLKERGHDVTSLLVTP